MLASSASSSSGRMLTRVRVSYLPSSVVLRTGRLAAVSPVSDPRPVRAVAAMAAQKSVLVPIGTGSEEMEAVITIDVLRRAGANVVVASVEDTLEVTCEWA